MILHPITLSFLGEWRSLEAEYRASDFEKTLLQKRVAILIAILFYALFGILDAYLLPEKKHLFWIIRYAAVCPFALAVFFFSFSRHFKKYATASIFTMFLVAGFGIDLMILIADPPVNFSYYAGIILVLIFLYTFLRIPFIWAFIASWLMILFYEGIALFFIDTPPIVLLNNNFFIIVGNIFCMLAGYTIEMSSRKNFFLSRMLDIEKNTVAEKNKALSERLERQLMAENALVEKNREIEQIVKYRTAELKESQEKYRDLVEQINELIFSLDKDGFITYMSPVADRMFGFTPAELIGRHFREFVHAEDIERLVAIFERKAGENIAVTEFRVCKKSGEYRWVEASSRPFAGAGASSGIRGVLRDITDLKLMEAQFRHAQKMDAVGTLAGGIAHDFNNLLHGIQGRVSLMAMDLPPAHHLAKHVEAIEKHVKSAAQLSNQLLGFARGGKYEVKPVDLNQIVRDTASMFGRTRKDVSITTKLRNRDAIVKADKTQIEQVLMNLFVNASEAMPSGGEIDLATSIVDLDIAFCDAHNMTPGRFVKLIVRDTGAGMDDATLQKIFDPFFTTKEKIRGTGLGLASAYGIIKNHGGVISVSSEPDVGTTFTLYLPESDTGTGTESDSEPANDSGTATVLLVDDEDIIIDVGKAMLEKLGYHVETALGGEEAFEIVKSKRIDLVILDLIMPDMDGGRVFDGIRTLQPDIAVLLSSGYTFGGQAEAILKKGGKGFIQKPFNISELSEKISSIINGGESPGPTGY